MRHQYKKCTIQVAKIKKEKRFTLSFIDFEGKMIAEVGYQKNRLQPSVNEISMVTLSYLI